MTSIPRMILLAGFFLACGVQAKGIRICWEAETADRIEPPVKGVTNGIEGASGAYLEIAEGAGNPPKVEAGLAGFDLEIPEDGVFTLWCRVWWEGECSNSFTVRVDDQPPFLFGEDATYKTWHWVKYPVSRTAPPLRLTRGRHTLTFLNREDGVRLDQILLSSDRRFVPADIEKAGARR